MTIIRNKILHQGFTLIEIMAVVFLIALIATSASVMFKSGGPQNTVNRDIENFVDRADQIADLAIINGEAMGLVLQPPLWSDDAAGEQSWSYRWQRFIALPDESGSLNFSWQDIEGIEPVAFDTELDLSVRLNGELWEWQNGPRINTPLFVLYPTGEAEPFDFELEVVHTDISVTPQHISFTDSGRLEWREALERQRGLAQRYQ